MKRYMMFALIVCLSIALIGTAIAGTFKGKAKVGPAFYDATIFNINLMQLSPKAAASLIAHNKSINHIYVVENSETGEEDPSFTPVLDAIQGDGFNPLWQEVLISPPTQFTSDNEVLAAASEPNATITLTYTDEIYRCSVVGSKK